MRKRGEAASNSMSTESARIRYYSDPVHDDYAGTNIDTHHVGEEFRYVRKSILWEFVAFIVYYIIAFPLVYLMAKIGLGVKFENRKVLRKLKGTGYFLYGNHTQVLDAYIPPLAAFPKRAYIIAGPDAVSIPGLSHIVMMLGALPIPTGTHAMRNFLKAIKTRCRQKACIAVYPEAHIWPYYTGIRPFPDTSFHYATKLNAPAVAMVTTYRKRKGLFALSKRPGMTVTFSEPMYPDETLAPREAQKELRDRVYNFMKEVSEGREQVEYIQYIYQPKEENE